jgi:hypothetical protein
MATTVTLSLRVAQLNRWPMPWLVHKLVAKIFVKMFPLFPVNVRTVNRRIEAETYS